MVDLPLWNSSTFTVIVVLNRKVRKENERHLRFWITLLGLVLEKNKVSSQERPPNWKFKEINFIQDKLKQSLKHLGISGLTIPLATCDILGRLITADSHNWAMGSLSPYTRISVDRTTNIETEEWSVVLILII